MSIFNSNKLTNQGRALLAKVLAGRTKLNFTIMQAGDGHFDGDVLDLTELVSWRLNGEIVGSRDNDVEPFTELDCFFTNETLTEMMEFREVGILAEDPDDGEILFCYTNAGNNASPIGAFNGIWLHEEFFTIRIYTANAENIRAEISTTAFATQTIFDNRISGLESTRVQGAIDELKLFIDAVRDEKIESLSEIRLMRGSENPTGSTSGALGQMFFNEVTGVLFVCVGSADGAYIWLFVGGGSGGEDVDVAWLGASFAGAAFLAPEQT